LKDFNYYKKRLFLRFDHVNNKTALYLNMKNYYEAFFRKAYGESMQIFSVDWVPQASLGPSLAYLAYLGSKATLLKVDTIVPIMAVFAWVMS
jgi:hypothetical protein